MGNITDLAFFAVVGYLGVHHTLGEPVLATLLSAYVAHRFGVAMGKQQAVIALSNNSGGGGGGGGGGGTGTSGTTMRAVEVPIVSAEVSVQAPGVIRPQPKPPIPRTDRRVSIDTTLFDAMSSVVGWMG